MDAKDGEQEFLTTFSSADTRRLFAPQEGFVAAAIQVTDPAVVSALLPVAEVLGPAWLSYLGPGDLVPPPPGGHQVEHLTAAHPEVRDLLGAATEDEAAESALEDVTSRAFVVRHGGAVVAAAGYQRWPQEVAHLSVLTAAPVRGRGLTGATAHAAVQDALARACCRSGGRDLPPPSESPRDSASKSWDSS